MVGGAAYLVLTLHVTHGVRIVAGSRRRYRAMVAENKTHSSPAATVTCGPARRHSADRGQYTASGYALKPSLDDSDVC